MIARITTARGLLRALTLAIVALQVSAAVGDVRQAGWFAKLPNGDRSRFFDPSMPTKKLKLGHWIRNAVPANETVRGKLTIGTRSRIQFAYALVCEGGTGCSGSAKFAADILGPEGEVLQRHVFSVDAPDDQWRVSQIDLSELATRHVTIQLSALVEQTAEGIGAFWSEPLSFDSPAKAMPNVVLISIDTLRADRLGCYGYDRDTSPALDALAADGVRFENAISQSPWTTPSHMSLFTGLYPTTHRVNQGFRDLQGFLLGNHAYRTLGDEVETLTEVLRDHGYRTVAMAGGGTMAGILGFDHGFDVFADGLSGELTPDVWSNLSSWLTDLRETPFFLFLHTFEVHAPYLHDRFAKELVSPEEAQLLSAYLGETHPDPIDAERSFLERHGLFRKEITSALYDGGIRYTDDFMGRLIGELRRLGLYDRTLIVVTSDHGEEFADHSRNRFYDAHCETLYDELIHVPLILRMPGKFTSGTVVREQARVVDVTPTILDLLGLRVPEAMQGQSLIGLMNGEPGQHDGWALSEATCIGPEWKSLRSNEVKYTVVGRPEDGERSGPMGKIVLEQFFDVTTDPGEQNNLLRERPDEARKVSRLLVERLDAYQRKSTKTSESTEIGEDVRERLRALGYLD